MALTVRRKKMTLGRQKTKETFTKVTNPKQANGTNNKNRHTNLLYEEKCTQTRNTHRQDISSSKQSYHTGWRVIVE